MTSLWREIDAQLRRSQAQAQFAAAASGARDWLSDPHLARSLLEAIAVLPRAADLSTLLDPLQESALGRLTQTALVTGHAETAAVDAPAPARAKPSPRSLRRAATAAPLAAADEPAARSSVLQSAALAAAVVNIPARIAALLARHSQEQRPLFAGVVKPTVRSAARPERKIVPFLGRRAGGDEPMVQRKGDPSLPSLAAMLARWGEIAAADPAERLQAATDRAGAGSDLTVIAASVLDTALRGMRAAAPSLAGSVSQAQPAPAVLRLADLVGSAALREARGSEAPVPLQPPLDAESITDSRAAGGDMLGRMAGALARIEERLVTPVPHAEPTPQWLADDDSLAERIHDILRHQALRHGIDAP